ncbi:MAG TPA: hypothetical protein VLE27_06480 [Thermoanaerobaculia bacterium]|nr:hypothetical protein [Thermoanaerobaculia bacterium]
MSRSPLRRWSAVFLLAATLFPLTLDTAHAGDLARSSWSTKRAPSLAPLWEAFLRLVAKTGSGLDPDGAPAPTGGGLDPDGAAAPVEEGGGLDPNGRT